MYSITLMLITIIGVTMACTEHYQCGNMPYSNCVKNFNPLPGIGLDSTNENVILLGTFNSTALNYQYISSLPTAGGPITSQYPVMCNVGGGSYYLQTNGMYAYTPYSKIPFLIAQTNPAPFTGPYFSNNGSFVQIWALIRYTLGLYFDDINSRTYYCDGNVHRINKIPSTANDRYDGAIDMYLNQNCNFLGVNGNDLYLLSIYYGDNGTTSKVYKGNINCDKCAASDLTKIATLNFEATAFQVTSTHMYFSVGYNKTTNGLIQLPLSGDMIALRWVVSDPILKFVMDTTGQWAFYQTTDRAIKKVGPMMANHPQTTVLYNPFSSPSEGTCSCAPDFKGNNCQSCSGSVQWVQGNPLCVPLNKGGAPLTCTQDYNCPNLPFQSCQQSTCVCRPGFTGTTCQDCKGSVTWNNGLPTCNL
ncbi:hypothetical protein SAMD00019534_032950 [Acytostelium subglobosum LB1]|uniref:hypothetical protein n=1 Tax=Acytostelium subglobosum LB1 TaxID=1410327 RepID=UPI000644C84D|nr:hypothetical protein SAMD00019534_032950 [Acytostelium subglobosum LB1]GAM20120.1 hypothetical protein SAMD00019534_032950 [Acytostelium subglobosum LB1]|eukprot:XP_012756882.1 hypothetical protein SAMD00019534_032950 [Acytostelium subglobosum LB1]